MESKRYVSVSKERLIEMIPPILLEIEREHGEKVAKSVDVALKLVVLQAAMAGENDMFQGALEELRGDIGLILCRFSGLSPVDFHDFLARILDQVSDPVDERIMQDAAGHA